MDKIKTLATLNSLNNNTLMQTLEIEFVDVGNDFVTAKMPVNSDVWFVYSIARAFLSCIIRCDGLYTHDLRIRSHAGEIGN